MALGLAGGDERIRAIGGDVQPTGYFEANHFHDGTHQVWYTSWSASADQIGMYFDGVRVLLFYNTSHDQQAGWRRVGPAVTPEWSVTPNLHVAGHAGGSGCTSFSITAVEYMEWPLSGELRRSLEL